VKYIIIEEKDVLKKEAATKQYEVLKLWPKFEKLRSKDKEIGIKRTVMNRTKKID
jgi:hypothetical protein